MSSTKALFGDDDSDSSSSSSEDESVKAAGEQQPAAGVEQKPADPAAAAAAPAAASSETKKDDDDDEDESDVEFDDAGVVGASGGGAKKPSASAVGGGESSGANKADDSASSRKSAPIQHWSMPEAPSAAPMMVITKLPNLIGINPQPFDPDTYDAMDEDEIYGVPNLLRWRYANKEDNTLLQTNTRLVQWEDDSWTLHVSAGGSGTTEAFEIDALDTRTSQGFAGLNGYLYMSSTADCKPEEKTDNDAENPTTTSAETTSQTVLESLSPLVNRWTIRPASLQSQAHKTLTLGIRQRTLKTAKIASIATQHDPEKLKQERIRNKMDLDKKNSRSGAGAAGRSFNQTKRPRKSRDYLEEDDRDFDTTNIRALKRGAYDDDQDEEYEGEDDGGANDDDPVFKKARSRKIQGNSFLNHGDSSASSSEEEELGDTVGQEESDEEEEGFLKNSNKQQNKKPNPKKRPQQAVVDDDEESD